MASDEFTKEALVIRVKRKLYSTDVVDALTDLFILRGPPEFIRSDNGAEFVAKKWTAPIEWSGFSLSHDRSGRHAWRARESGSRWRSRPLDDVMPFTRRDTQHANPDHRPTQAQYEAYISLVQGFRALGWDNARLHDASPFRVVDPGFNAILIRSASDLAWLAEQLGETAIAARVRDMAKAGLAAFETLWSDGHGQYLCFDRVAGRPINSPSIGGLLAVFAGVPAARAQAIARRIADLGGRARFMVPSHDPGSPDYDGKRYWRGPLWLIVNYMIADGLRNAGEDAVADRIVDDSLALIDSSGFAEYYDSQTGEPCGGGCFTWTAAMIIEFLTGRREEA